MTGRSASLGETHDNWDGYSILGRLKEKCDNNANVGIDSSRRSQSIAESPTFSFNGRKTGMGSPSWSAFA